jgi:hypothetical protein
VQHIRWQKKFIGFSRLNPIGPPKKYPASNGCCLPKKDLELMTGLNRQLFLQQNNSVGLKGQHFGLLWPFFISQYDRENTGKRAKSVFASGENKRKPSVELHLSLSAFCFCR